MVVYNSWLVAFVLFAMSHRRACDWSCHYFMRRKKTLLCLFLLLIVISSWRTRSRQQREARLVFQVGPLDDPIQAIRRTEQIDTYFRRVHRFLSERNRSIRSYETMIDDDPDLLGEIQQKMGEITASHRQELEKIRNGEERRNGCRSSCCWSEKKMSNFYNGESTRSPMVLDRLSAIDFKLLADVHYGSLPVPDGIQLPKLSKAMLPCLQNNTIIYVDTPELGRFLRFLHPSITINYILITGDSDLSCPSRLGRSHSSLLNQILAGQTHILHWFAMNCDLEKPSSTFSCLPQGINQWFAQRYYLQLASGKDDSVGNTFLKTNDYWILTSFNRKNGAEHRQPLWNLACHGRLKNISKCFYGLNSLDQWRYYLHIARSRFVFSPPGAGLDCYRTWEALYLGSIPIILRSSINSLFDRLPVLIVDRYDEITLPFLEKAYQNITRQVFDYRRLYKGYWQSRINAFRQSSETIQIHYTPR